MHCLQISLDAIKSEVPEVSLQGIEFWSTVCDEEIDLDLEAEEVRSYKKIVFLIKLLLLDSFISLFLMFKV